MVVWRKGKLDDDASSDVFGGGRKTHLKPPLTRDPAALTVPRDT